VEERVRINTTTGKLGLPKSCNFRKIEEPKVLALLTTKASNLKAATGSNTLAAFLI